MSTMDDVLNAADAAYEAIVNDTLRKLEHVAWCAGRDTALKTIIERGAEPWVCNLVRDLKSPYEDGSRP